MSMFRDGPARIRRRVNRVPEEPEDEEMQLQNDLASNNATTFRYGCLSIEIPEDEHVCISYQPFGRERHTWELGILGVTNQLTFCQKMNQDLYLLTVESPDEAVRFLDRMNEWSAWRR